jgi:hypothetical protein
MDDAMGIGDMAIPGTPNFINPSYATPEQRAQMYKYASALMQPQPINNGWQGLAAMARALIGGSTRDQASQLEQQNNMQQQQKAAATIGTIDSPSSAAPVGQAPSAGASPMSGANGAPVDPGPAAPAAAAYLMKNGVSNPLGAAALAGNFQAESGFNPAATRPGDGHDGSAAINIGQWNGPRAQAFQQFAAVNKLDPSDPQTGLAFASRELHSTEAPALAALNAATTPEQANAAALSYFRPAGYTAKDPTQSTNYTGRLALTNATAASLAAAAARANGAGMPPGGAPGAPGPQAPIRVAQNGGNGLPVSAQAIGSLIGDPNTPPDVRAMAQGLLHPQMMTSATGGVSPIYQNRPNPAPPIFNAGILRDQTPGSVPAVVGGTPGAPTNTIAPPALAGAPLPAPAAMPAGGTNTPPTTPNVFGPGSVMGDLARQQQAVAAQGANTAAKQSAASARYQAAQDAGPQLMAASYPLRQLQAIMARNGGMIPSGEGSEQLMHGLSVANMLGTLIGHPIASEDSNLPTLELLKKYGMQAAQAQSQSLGLHTNLGLESAEITSPNPALSGPANAHLVDNLVRLNQVAQKKAQFEHDLFLKNGQGPDAYDNATTAWQEATTGRNAIPLASAKFGHQYTNAQGQKRVIVPSTDASGFSVYSPDDPAVADIGPQGK